MVLTLMSRSSKETSEWRGSPSAWWPLLWCSVLMVLNGLRKIRVAKRQQRTLLQVKSEKAEPQSAQGDRQYQIKPCWYGARSKFRPRHPEEVDKPHEDEPNSDFGKDLGPALHVLRKEQEKRNKKVKDDHDHCDDAPFPVEPRSKETDFFGLVAGPDDQ